MKEREQRRDNSYFNSLMWSTTPSRHAFGSGLSGLGPPQTRLLDEWHIVYFFALLLRGRVGWVRFCGGIHFMRHPCLQEEKKCSTLCKTEKGLGNTRHSVARSHHLSASNVRCKIILFHFFLTVTFFFEVLS